jgi:transcriptional regulator GlxA family with amidase domain
MAGSAIRHMRRKWTVRARKKKMMRSTRPLSMIRPIPAVVADAITQAMVRMSERMTVPALAVQLGYSPRGLRLALARAGAPQPQQLISWGRVLWAVHDLCSDPTARSDRVAWSLGFSGPTVLGNALCRRLGVRINAAREKGLDWAIERFVQVSGLCDPLKAPPHADRGG